MESRTARVVDALRNSSTKVRRYVGAMALASALIPVVAPQIAHSETTALSLRVTCAAKDHGPGNAKLTNTTDKDILGTFKFLVAGQLVNAGKSFDAVAKDETTYVLDNSYEDKTLVAVDSNGNATNSAVVNCEPDVLPSSTTLNPTTTLPGSTTTIENTSTTRPPVTASTTTIYKVSSTTSSLPAISVPVTTIAPGDPNVGNGDFNSTPSTSVTDDGVHTAPPAVAMPARELALTG